MIKREVKTWERMVQVISTMPNPEPVIIDRYIQDTIVYAKNKNGVCEYRYVANGVISASFIRGRLADLNIEVKEIK